MISRSISATLLLLAGLLGSCKPGGQAAGSAASSATDSSAASEAGAPVAVVVTAKDYSFESPTRVPAGVITMRLVNRGKELHQAQIVRLDEGKTVADLEKAMKQHGPLPSWIKFVGGPNGIAPGDETNGQTSLSPGKHVVICLIPSADGVPHLMKGMIQPLEVTAAPGATTAGYTEATDTIRLVDYNFQSNRELTPGRRTILVENAGPQPHEFVLVKLAPGKSLKDFATWAETMKGPPPAVPLGGVGVVEKGGRGQFTVDLTPGEYGYICFVPDAKDGKLHLVHGMMKQVKVG
jgi:plastocyanin